jgi:NAD(P)-dependent dehydrogenase (short-subunit alcohol dehydrogenase family)
LPGDRKELVSKALLRYGRIDALVNSGGPGQRNPIETIPLETIRQRFETNLFTLIALTQLVIPVMRKEVPVG